METVLDETDMPIAVDAIETENLPAQVSEIMQSYCIKAEQIKELKDKYSALKIVDAKDKAGYEAVRVGKSEVVKALTDLERDRKKKKQESLDYGRNVDRAAAILESHLLPVKRHLETEKNRIDAEEEAEKQRKQADINARVAARVKALTAVNAVGAVPYQDLPGMAEADFQAHLAVATAKWNDEQKVKAAQEAEIARLQAQEAERKAGEAAEAQRVAKANAAEKARLEGIANAQAAKEAAIQAERDKMEGERRKLEADKQAEVERAARAKQAELDAVARAAEMEKARVEAAEKARKEAEAEAARKAKAESDRLEAERKEAERLAALKPDRIKMLAYAEAIRAVPVPEIRAEAMKKRLLEFQTAQLAFVNSITK